MTLQSTLPRYKSAPTGDLQRTEYFCPGLEAFKSASNYDQRRQFQAGEPPAVARNPVSVRHCAVKLW